jgi:uncharacterized protein (TIGR03437 family)
MKSPFLISGLLAAAALCNGQTYQPRVNFGARLEPQGALVHGAGQSADAFTAYWNAMPASGKPTAYMWYINLAGLSANWSDSLKAQLLAYPNEFIVPQVGLSLTNGVGSGGPYDADVAAGAYDAQIANLVTGLERLATPVYLRIGYEFNGTLWNGYTPATYKQAFIRVTNAIRAANLEVATVWDASADASDGGITNYMDYYPGDTYVDWYGMNMYGVSMFNNDSALTPFFVMAVAHQKPVMLAEQSPRPTGAQNGATSWNAWFAQFFNFMAATPVVKQFDYIDWNWANHPQWSTWGDARLETDAATYVRTLYIAQLANPMMLNAGSETAFRKLLAYHDTTPPPMVTDLGAAAAANGVVLTWTPVEDPSGIARYYIYRDGAFLSFSLGSGYVDAAVAPNTEHSYTVAAMDRAGNLAAPSNVATATVASVVEMLWNGNFENGLSYWQANSYDSGAVGTAVASKANPMDGTASAMLTVSKSTGTAWHLQLLQGFNMTEGMIYTLSFKARASAPVSLPLMIQLASNPYTVYLGPTAAVTANASLFQYSFLAPASATVNASFEYGNINPNTVWLDDVSVKESTNASLGTGGWQLEWSDEFNGAAGTPPDPASWNYILGPGCCNGELETYTNSSNNVFQDGKGNLVIRAVKDAQGKYTSTLLQTGSPGASTHTADLSWQYGLIEARIKLPFGKGVWPAFWMMGEDNRTVGWPTCGEVDIMENFGTFNDNATVNNGTIHGPVDSSTSPAAYAVGASKSLPFGETVYDDYHVYAIVWSQDSIEFFVDGSPYETLGPSWLAAGAPWSYNAPFYLILDLAIGGPTTWLGTPDASVTFPQDMLVDYVRIYRPAPISATTPAITPASVVNAASYLGAISPGALASVFGTNLAGTSQMAPLSNGNFPITAAGTTVSVNSVNAPLVYVSPTQINFQIPWETQPGLAVPVTVTWNGVTSAPEIVTIASTASPSFFLSEYVNGTAWVTGAPADGCATYSSECAVKAGSTYQLWVNGLGPKTAALQDGVPAPMVPLQVPGGPDSCQLTIGGQTAKVWYCGVAPGEIIDQVNFTYPAGVSTSAAYADAALTVNGVTGHFRVPAPAAK